MTKSQKTSNVGSPPSFVVEPGVGSKNLHIGQTEEEVLTVLGKPENVTRKYKGQYFYDYPSKGLEVDFGKSGGRVKYLYFFRSGVRGNQGANVVTTHGIRPGAPRRRVLELLGEPQERGAPVELNSGSRFGEWFSYASGLNVQFGEDKRVDMITVTRPHNLPGRSRRRV